MRQVALITIILLGTCWHIEAASNHPPGIITTEERTLQPQDEAFNRLTGKYRHWGEGIVIDERVKEKVAGYEPGTINTNGFSFKTTNPQISTLASHYAYLSRRTLLISKYLDVEQVVIGEITLDSTNVLGKTQANIVGILASNGCLIVTADDKVDIMMNTNKSEWTP